MKTYQKILLVIVTSPLMISSFLILDIGMSETNPTIIASMLIPISFLGLFLFVFFRYELNEDRGENLLDMITERSTD